MPFAFGVPDGLIATFSRSMSACVVPVKFWKPGTMPAGDAGQQDREQVGPVLLVRTQVREHAGVEDGQELGELGLRDVLRVVLVSVRSGCVPVVLAAHRDDHLVEEGVAEARDLHERADG